MTSLSTRITDQIINMIINRKYPDGVISQKVKREQRRSLLGKLEDPNNYLSFELRAGLIRKLIFAEFSNSPVLYDRIACQCFYFDDELCRKKVIIEEIHALREHFGPKKLQITLASLPSERKLKRILNSLHFLPAGTKLVGEVNLGIKALEKKISRKKPLYLNMIKDLTMEPFIYELHLEKVMKLEWRAHRSEPTSFVHKMKRNDWWHFRGLLSQLSKKKSAFILLKGRQMIGFIAFNKRNELQKRAMIASISLEPDFKNLGLSSLLYLEALKAMRKKRITHYYGFSSTAQVLASAKKIGRVPMEEIYRLSKEDCSNT